MNERLKREFLTNLKDGLKCNKEVFSKIAHDELEHGFAIHTEFYNDVINKYSKMEIEEKNNKITVIYDGYSWITLEFLVKAVLENSQVLLVNFYNKIITSALITLIEEVCKSCKIESPVIKLKKEIDKTFVMDNCERFDKIYFIGNQFDYDNLPIKDKIIYNNFGHIKMIIDKKKYLNKYKEILTTVTVENYTLEEFDDFSDYLESYSKDDCLVIFCDDQALIEKTKALELNNLYINNFSFDNYKFNIKMNSD